MLETSYIERGNPIPDDKKHLLTILALIGLSVLTAVFFILALPVLRRPAAESRRVIPAAESNEMLPQEIAR